MGLLDLHREIVTEFRADISDHKAKVKELDGAEKELAETELANAEARNEHISSWLEGAAKVALAITAVKELGEIAWEGYLDGVKDAKLANAAYGISIEKLKEASHGLVTENKLLEFAAKANKAAFRNSQADMENAQRAMYALTQQGRDQAAATDAVSNAINNLKVKGLTDMGIYVDTSKVKFDESGNVLDNYDNKLELHQKILDAVKMKADEVSEGQEGIGDSMGKTVVDLQDAWDELKKGLGQLVVAFEPILKALALTAKLAAEIAKNGKLETNSGGGIDWQAQAASMSNGKINAESYRGKDNLGQGLDALAQAQTAIEGLSNVRLGVFNAGLDKLKGESLDALKDTLQKLDYLGNIEMGDDTIVDKATREAIAARAKEEARRLRELSNKVEKQLTDDLLAQLQEESGAKEVGIDQIGKANASGQADIDRAKHSAEAAKKLQTDLEKMSKEIGEQPGKDEKARQTGLAKVFGPIGDFDLYAEAFKALEGAVSGAMGAWIDGSMSAGDAFKKFIGEALKSLASQMAVESLKNAAYGIASLVPGPFFNPGAAGGYFAASAAFAGGAALAAVGAKEFGAGSSSASAGGSAGAAAGSSTSSGAPGGGANQNTGAVTIVYENGFTDQSPRMRQSTAKKLVNLALGTSAGRNS